WVERTSRETQRFGTRGAVLGLVKNSTQPTASTLGACDNHALALARRGCANVLSSARSSAKCANAPDRPANPTRIRADQGGPTHETAASRAHGRGGGIARLATPCRRLSEQADHPCCDLRSRQRERHHLPHHRAAARHRAENDRRG